MKRPRQRNQSLGSSSSHADSVQVSAFAGETGLPTVADASRVRIPERKDIDSRSYMSRKRVKVMEQMRSSAIGIGGAAVLSSTGGGVGGGKESRSDEMEGLFKNVVVYVNGITHPTARELEALVWKHGGKAEKMDRGNVTHILCQHLPAAKIKKILELKGVYSKRVVTPRWVLDSIARRRLLPCAEYFIPQLKPKSRLTFRKRARHEPPAHSRTAHSRTAPAKSPDTCQNNDSGRAGPVPAITRASTDSAQSAAAGAAAAAAAGAGAGAAAGPSILVGNQRVHVTQQCMSTTCEGKCATTTAECSEITPVSPLFLSSGPNWSRVAMETGMPGVSKTNIKQSSKTTVGPPTPQKTSFESLADAIQSTRKRFNNSKYEALYNRHELSFFVPFFRSPWGSEAPQGHSSRKCIVNVRAAEPLDPAKSMRFYSVMENFSAEVEPVSGGHCYLAFPVWVNQGAAERLQSAAARAVGHDCHVGVGATKTVAYLAAAAASKAKETCTVRVIRCENQTPFLSKIRFSDIPTVGAALLARLRALRIESPADYLLLSGRKPAELDDADWKILQTLAQGQDLVPFQAISQANSSPIRPLAPPSAKAIRAAIHLPEVHENRHESSGPQHRATLQRPEPKIKALPRFEDLSREVIQGLPLDIREELAAAYRRRHGSDKASSSASHHSDASHHPNASPKTQGQAEPTKVRKSKTFQDIKTALARRGTRTRHAAGFQPRSRAEVDAEALSSLPPDIRAEIESHFIKRDKAELADKRGLLRWLHKKTLDQGPSPAPADVCNLTEDASKDESLLVEPNVRGTGAMKTRGAPPPTRFSGEKADASSSEPNAGPIGLPPPSQINLGIFMSLPTPVRAQYIREYARRGQMISVCSEASQSSQIQESESRDVANEDGPGSAGLGSAADAKTRTDTRGQGHASSSAEPQQRHQQQRAVQVERAQPRSAEELTLSQLDPQVLAELPPELKQSVLRAVKRRKKPTTDSKSSKPPVSSRPIQPPQSQEWTLAVERPTGLALRRHVRSLVSSRPIRVAVETLEAYLTLAISREGDIAHATEVLRVLATLIDECDGALGGTAGRLRSARSAFNALLRAVQTQCEAMCGSRLPFQEMHM